MQSSVLGVGQILVSKNDAVPSHGAYGLPYPPPASLLQEEKLLTNSLPASPPLPLPQQASWLKSSRPIPRPDLAVSAAFCKCELPSRSWLWLWLWWWLWLWFRLWLWLWLCLRLWLLLWGSTLDRSTLTPSWIRYFWLIAIIYAYWLIITINW